MHSDSITAVHSEELARRHALARERVAGGLPPASARHLGRVLPPSGVAVLEGVNRAFDKDERLRAGKLQKLEAVRINSIAKPGMNRNVGESQSLRRF